MISVPFELEKVEFGILILGIPLPEKFQKERGLNLTLLSICDTFKVLPPITVDYGITKDVKVFAI